MDWEEFLNKLPEDVRNNDSIKSIKSIEEFGKQFVEKDKLVGKMSSRIEPITKDSTPEQRLNFFKKLGLPESPDKYSFLGKLTEDKYKMYVKGTDKIAETLHNQGVSDEQASAIFENYVDLQNGLLEEYVQSGKAEKEAKLAKLKEKFGDEFDTKDQMAKNTLKNMFGGDEFADKIVEVLNNSGITLESDLITRLESVSEEFQEDKAKYIRGGKVNNKITDAEGAAKKLEELDKDPDYVASLFDPKHKEHAKNTKERKELFEQAYPSDVPGNVSNEGITVS